MGTYRDHYENQRARAQRVVFTSTLFNKRFHVFTAELSDGNLSNLRRVTGERKSDLPRYYYSSWADRLAEAVGVYPDWNDAAEKSAVLEKVARAKAIFAWKNKRGRELQTPARV